MGPRPTHPSPSQNLKVNKFEYALVICSTCIPRKLCMFSSPNLNPHGPLYFEGIYV